MSKIALVTDFDGTISDNDFFWHVVNHYLEADALKPWEEYMAGRMHHIDALNAIFAKIKVPEAELLSFTDTITLDKTFYNLLELCKKKEIPVYIVSAGCDYYIRRLLGNKIKDYGVKLVTNHGVYSKENGLKMLPPTGEAYYDEAVGISKAAVVKELQEQGYEVIYAGDGPPDVEPAKIADVVFAKKILLKRCQELGIKTQKFESFNDVINYLEDL